MTTSVTTPAESTPESALDQELELETPPRNRLRVVVLAIGAFLFIFPFYYMVVGSFQAVADKSLSGTLPHPDNMTWTNYQEINQAIDAPRSLLNSSIFTIGVLLFTVVF